MCRIRLKTSLAVFFLFIALAQQNLADSWIGHLGGRSIKAMVFDSRRSLMWFATDNGGAFSFDGANFVSYNVISTDGGLASDNLTAIAIDTDYDLWFGTVSSGVSRFNPETQKWVSYDTSNSKLASNKIGALAVDLRGCVWIGTTDSGACRFDGKEEWLCLNTGNGLRNNGVRALTVDRDNNVWIATQEQGVSVLRADGSWCYYLPAERMQSIFIAADGTREIKWLGSARGLFKLETAGPNCNGTPEKIPFVPNSPVSALFADEYGDLWLGNYPGALRLNRAEDYARRFNEDANLGSLQIISIAGDGEGNIWFGANFQQGAIKYGANWATYTTIDSLPSNSIQALREDANAGIWAGTRLGLAQLRGTRWRSYTFASECADQNDIAALAFDSSGGLWLGTGTCGAMYIAPPLRFDQPTFYTTAHGLTSDIINEVALYHDEVWLATERGLNWRRRGATHWDTLTTANSELINDRVRALAIDRHGIVWCGTTDGVSRYDRTNWQSFTSGDGLAGDWIHDIAIDDTSGLVWFATEGQGVSRYDWRNDQWRTYSTDDGLASNLVNAIALDKKAGAVWFGTGNGASYFEPLLDRWTNYTTLDGLGENLVQALLRDSNGRVWFGSVLRGVTRYQSKKNPPQVHLLNPFEVTTASEITYEFSGSDLGTSARLMRYSYKLDGGEYQRATPATSARVLIPGNGLHTFYVKAIDTDGNESDETSDAFYKIHPDTGQTSIETDYNVFGRDSVSVRLYWPPYQFPDNLILSLAIEPVDTTALAPNAILAYDFESNQIDIKQRGVILSFEFPETKGAEPTDFAIYQELDSLGRTTGVRLGGTPQKTAPSLLNLSTHINQFGRYSVRYEVNADAGSFKIPAAEVRVTPRLFSPLAGGHGAQTTLSFPLQANAHVRISAFNLAGRLVKIVWDDFMSAGLQAVAWDGRDRDGRICPSGLYIMVVENAGNISPQKVMLLNETSPR